MQTNRKLLPMLCSAMLVSVPAMAATWSDAFIGLRHGTSYREPANPEDITKTIVQFQYVAGNDYGSNFINADVLMSDHKDPAANGGGGAQEVYLVYRNLLSFGALSGQSMAMGPVRDVAMTTGVDLSSKDDAFAARVRKLMIGPTLRLDVPGFWDVTLLLRKEHNHNGIVGKNVHFKSTWGVSSAWGIPLGDFQFKGFIDFVGPKGKDGFGVETKTETLLETALMYDLGQQLGHKNSAWVGVGYQYWHNKFGNPGGTGTKASVPQLLVEMHF